MQFTQPALLQQAVGQCKPAVPPASHPHHLTYTPVRTQGYRLPDERCQRGNVPPANPSLGWFSGVGIGAAPGPGPRHGVDLQPPTHNPLTSGSAPAGGPDAASLPARSMVFATDSTAPTVGSVACLAPTTVPCGLSSTAEARQAWVQHQQHNSIMQIMELDGLAGTSVCHPEGHAPSGEARVHRLPVHALANMCLSLPVLALQYGRGACGGGLQGRYDLAAQLHHSSTATATTTNPSLFS